MSSNNAKLCVSAIRQYVRKGTPAISVAYLDNLSGDAWSYTPGFHEQVKKLAFDQYGIEMVYVYERPKKPHWALDSSITDEIRQRYTYERLQAFMVEFERFIARQPGPAPAVLTLVVGQLRLAWQFVGRPDPDRLGDPVLTYIDSQ